MNYDKGKHTAYFHRYHLVWVTKYRYKSTQRRNTRKSPRDYSSGVFRNESNHYKKGIIE